MVKVSKNDQKLKKCEFFNSKFEFLVIFGPFTPLAQIFHYFFLKLLTFIKNLKLRF